jgi:hypothetical protein
MTNPSGVITIKALRTLFPDYRFNLISKGGDKRIEAVARDPASSVYCLISRDAREIWRELAKSAT